MIYRFNITVVMLCVMLVSGCGKTPATVPAEQEKKIIDFTSLIKQKAADLTRKDFSPRSTTEVYKERKKQQDEMLKEFDRSPAEFLKKYHTGLRTFVFDAVVDPVTMRIGTFEDGGKWVASPQDIKPGDVIYSFGVGHDVSFDLEMAGRFGCEVYMFDPSPAVEKGFADFKSGMSYGRGHLFYQPLGLGPVSMDPAKKDDLVIEGKKCPVKNMAEIARSLKHKRIDILKMDIEGGEVPALLEMLGTGTLKKLGVKQLLVEVHFWDDDQFSGFVRIVGGLKKQGYHLFRKEFNPGDGYKCGEYAFVRM